LGKTAGESIDKIYRNIEPRRMKNGNQRNPRLLLWRRQ
jgi:hypothetical protein